MQTLKRHQPTEAERWKNNRPVDPRAIDRFPLGSVLLLLAVLAGVIWILGGALAEAGETENREAKHAPVIHAVIFKSHGCTPCAQLDGDGLDIFAGCNLHTVTYGSAEWGRYYAEFCRTVSLDASINLTQSGYIGPLSARPAEIQVPSIWFPHGDGYWNGYRREDRDHLAAWIHEQRVIVSKRFHAQPYRRSVPTLPRSINAPGTWQDSVEDAMQTDPPMFVDHPSMQYLEGVHLVACLGELSDEHVELRSSLAKRIDRSLQEVAERYVGGKVRAHFVARVADRETFDRLVEITGIDPRDDQGDEAKVPVVLHLLIPEHFGGIKGLIARRVETALQQHFFEAVRVAKINPIIQRLDGGTYEAAVAAVTSRLGPLDDSPGPFDPITFFASAWLSERSNLARRILSYFKVIA